MNLQYISDSKGRIAGVFIPIEVWDNLKEKFGNIKIENSLELHKWQKDIIDERLNLIAKGDEKFQDFNATFDEVEKDI